MQIAIIGLGAMGSLFGAYLCPCADVTLLGEWPEQLVALREDGLRLEMADGRITFCHPYATNDLSQVPPVDLALILVKSPKTESAANVARQLLKQKGLVLTLQNGLGNLEKLTAVLGADRVALGVTSAGATMVGAGHVRVAGLGHTYLAGQPDTAVTLAQVAALFQRAGFPTELTDNPDSLVWGKLAVNAGINPLTALLRVPNGYLAEHMATRKIMAEAAYEVAAVAQALGITLPYSDAAQRILEVAQATATNHSSMLQDVLRQVPTEIEAISGAVVSYGRALHIPTPVNQMLLEQIRKLERGDWNLEIDREAIISNLQSQISEVIIAR
jgi:2-dehydropantoate 2-reductase